MPDSDREIDFDGLQRRMDGALAALRQEFASLRTGRASAGMLEPIHVDAYGQMTPINQLGTVNVPEPRMVTINVWDRSMVAKVEKAIRDSGLGINPMTDGPIIRLPIPELNEERRRELTKVVRHAGEEGKVAVRAVRRDANEHLKRLLKDKQVGEDEERRAQERVQDLTDRTIAEIDRLVAAKEADVMAV